MVALTGTSGDEEVVAAWAQVAGLKPRLAPHVEVVKHSYRGAAWYVLADKMAATHFRCTPAVEQFLSLLDGVHTVADAYAACAGATAGEPPTQEEVLRLLAELQSSHLLLGGVPVASTQAYEQQRQLRRTRWLRRIASPLALQIPLLDPDQLLARLLPWFRPLFSALFLWLWFLIVAIAGVAALSQWSELGVHWQSRFLDPGNLLSVWLLYPLVKGLHELGHGLATRFWGGEVHEMGIMLLVFTPVPYVDASASSAFNLRHQRVVVAAAGIMVELLLAALALWAWSYSSPGLWRDACFNVMAIGGLSTLLFNGNPLLRFDGYYVFSDLLEIPNLRARSNQYLGYLLKRYLLSLPDKSAPPASARERAWLLGYAISSGIYRLLISVTIALFVAGKYFFLGASLALWLLGSQLLWPLYRIFASLLANARSQNRVLRLCAVSGGGLVLLLLAVFVVRVPDSNHAEGIVNLPQNARIRTQAAGFVQNVFKREGQFVRAGEPLLELDNLELRASEVALLARSRELKLRHSLALSGERVEIDILRQEIDALQEEIHEVQTQLSHLIVRSPHDGVFALARASDLPGRFVGKGELVGHVIDHSELTVRVVVSQAVIDQVRSRTQAIEVRLASNPGHLLNAVHFKQIPMSTSQLPSALLGSRAGGDIAVDARDQRGRQAINSVFQLDVSLPPGETGAYLGQGALVRFVYQREALGTGWYRQLRQLLLSQLGI